MKTRSAVAAGFALTCGFATLSVALAQEAPQAPASTGGLEDIVVTAQRRAESLQSVPIAVSAITAANLSRAGIGDSTSLANVVPGLTMSNQAGTLTPYLRGVGTQSGGGGEEGSIATYVDGVYVPTLSGTTLAFNNIERVEVLKGPQGTLFGRNATGGLIHIITKDPSFDPAGSFGASYGNYDTVSGNAYVTGGLSEKVAADLAGYFSHQGDGWGRNLTLGNDVNKLKEWGIRSKILMQPSDDLTITLAANYSHRNTDIGVTRQIAPGAVIIGGAIKQGSIYDTRGNEPLDNKFWQAGVSSKIVYDFGDIKLQSLTSYSKDFYLRTFDADSSPLRVVLSIPHEKTENVQQEFLLTGNSNRFAWTAGAYFLHTNAKNDPISNRSALIPTTNTDRFATQKTTSYAGFAQGTYEIFDATKVTAGLRYTTDKRKISAVDFAVAGYPVIPVGGIVRSVQGQSKFNKLTWRFAVDQQLSQNALLYGSLSRGFKSGLYNLSNPYQAPVKPETLDAYEVGFKSDLAGRTLRLNASAYLYNYKNIQLIRVIPGTTEIFNAARARIKGIDAEFVYAPRLEGLDLQFTAGAAYTHGKYLRFPAAPISTRNPAGGNTSVAGDASGNFVIRTPKFAANAGVNLGVPIGAYKASFDANYAYNSGVYWDPDNRVKQHGYSLVNVRAAFGPDNGPWEIGVFAKNLTQTRYIQTFSSSAVGDQISPGAPRTYGVSVGYKFGG